MRNETIFLQTNDIEEIAILFGGPTLNPVKLSSGKFEGRLLQVPLNDDIQCWQLNWNQKVQLLGSLPPGTVSLWIPITAGFRGIWQGFECHSHQVILNVDGKIDYTQIAGEQVACITTNQQHYLGGFGQVHLSFSEKEASKQGILVPDRDRLQILHKHLEEIFALAIANPNLSSRSYLAELIIQNLLPGIIDLTYSATDLSQKSSRSLNRILKFKRAVEFIRANLNQPLTLQILSSEIGISPRSLIYSFREFLGMGPMEYYKSNRLNAVRQCLKTANANTDTVVVIAKRWGFRHMGHFSADYRAMFGELPSETLQRSF